MAENLEAKFDCDDLDDAERRAVDLGAEFSCELVQVDTYLRVPHGRLKLREQLAPSIEAELIRYDREDVARVRSSRYERVPVDDPQGLSSMLIAALGEPFAVVRKRRRLYLLESARIHLDAVESLGSFVEFEVVRAVDQTDENAWSATANALAERIVKGLSLRPENVRSGSYSDLLASDRAGGYKG